MKKLLIVILVLLFGTNNILNGQQVKTIKPRVGFVSSRCTVQSVVITEQETIINLSFACDGFRASWAAVYPDTYMRDRDGNQYPILRLEGRVLGKHYYSSTSIDFTLVFDKLPAGKDVIDIIDPSGLECLGVKINNTAPRTRNIGMSEIEIKQLIKEQNDGIVGIYEEIGGNKYQLACIKHEGEYKLVFIYSPAIDIRMLWDVGCVKAVLRETATLGFFKADWYAANRSLYGDVYITFDGKGMKALFEDGKESMYIKMYPTSNDTTPISQKGEWSGTGFALNDGYVITNFHVVDGATNIHIQGVGGNFNTKYKAEVVASDKFNDIALLKVEGLSVDNIPYAIKTTTTDVGEDVFVLGYPLTSTMGEEIKLTTGIISSKTGYQGDVSLYQISAPIQPGNSGGPLFDGSGNVIGVVSAKHNGAENVGYAIKASYIRNLMESVMSNNILPRKNSITTQKLSEKVKFVKDYVYYITCSN